MPSPDSTSDYARATAVCVLRQLAERDLEEGSPFFVELHDVAEAFERHLSLVVPAEPCHLTDPAGVALCFADLTGREPHDRETCVEAGHALCARCVAIEQVQVQDEDEL